MRVLTSFVGLLLAIGLGMGLLFSGSGDRSSARSASAPGSSGQAAADRAGAVLEASGASVESTERRALEASPERSASAARKAQSAAIQFEVLELNAGVAVESASVFLWLETPAVELGRVLSDGRGLARFEGLLPGTYGYTVADRASGRIELVADAREHVTVELDDPTGLLIEVVKPTGTPAAAARVYWAEPAFGAALQFVGSTDARGQLHLAGLSSGGWLQAIHADFGSSGARPLGSPELVSGTAQLALRPGTAELRLTVPEPVGAVGPIRVELHPTPANPALPTTASVRPRIDVLSPAATHALPHLKPGSWTLRASARDGASAVYQLELAAGRTELLLHLEPAIAVLGRLVDTDGTPVGAATVGLGQPGELDHRRATTAPDGRFELTVAPGLHEVLWVRKAGWRPLDLPLPDPSAEWNLRLHRLDGVQVQGIAQDGSASPIAGALVIARPQNSEQGMAHARTAPDGSFSLRLDPKFEYAVELRSGAATLARRKSYRASSGYLNLVAEAAQLPTGSLHGSLGLLDSGVAEGALHLRVSGPNGVSAHEVRPAEDGSFCFLQIPEGTGSLIWRSTHSGVQALAADLEVGVEELRLGTLTVHEPAPLTVDFPPDAEPRVLRLQHESGIVVLDLPAAATRPGQSLELGEFAAGHYSIGPMPTDPAAPWRPTEITLKPNHPTRITL